MNTIIPNVQINKIVISSGGKPLDVNNPHIRSESEGSLNTESLTTIDLYFKLFDTFSLNASLPMVDEESLKFIKLKIYYFYDDISTNIVNGITFYPTGYDLEKSLNAFRESSNILFRPQFSDRIKLIELGYDSFKNLLTYSLDNNNNQYFEVNYTIKTSNIPNDLENLSVFIVPTIDLNKLADFYNLDRASVASYKFRPDEGSEDISTDTGVNARDIYENYTYKVIKSDSQYIIDPIIINNIILNDLQAQLDNLIKIDNKLFDVNNFEIPINISKYFGDLYISRKSDNSVTLLFGFDPVSIIKEQTLFGSNNSIINQNTSIVNGIINNFLEQSTIKIFRQPVTKNQQNNNKITYTTIGVKEYLNNFETRIINNKTYYVVVDDILKINSSTNSLYQYGIDFTIKDVAIELLSEFYYLSLEGVRQLQNYYNLAINTKYYNYIENKFTDPDNSLPNKDTLLSYVEPFYVIYAILKSIKNDIQDIVSLSDLVNLIYWENTTPNSIKNVINLFEQLLERLNNLLKINKIVVDSATTIYTSGINSYKTITYSYTNELLEDNFFFDQKHNSFKYFDSLEIDEADSIPKYVGDSNVKLSFDNFSTDSLIYDENYDNTKLSLVVNYYNNKNLFDSTKEYKNIKSKNKLIISARNGINFQSTINDIANKKNCLVSPKLLDRVTSEATYNQDSFGNPSMPLPRGAATIGLDIRESFVARRGIPSTSEESIDFSSIYSNVDRIEDSIFFENIQRLLNTIFIENSPSLVIPQAKIQIYNNEWLTLNNLNSNLLRGTFLARIITSDLTNPEYDKAINNFVISNKYFILTLGNA